MMYNVLIWIVIGFFLNGYNSCVSLNLYFFYFLDVFEDISKNLELDVNGKLDGKLMADDGGCYVMWKSV